MMKMVDRHTFKLPYHLSLFDSGSIERVNPAFEEENDELHGLPQHHVSSSESDYWHRDVDATAKVVTGSNGMQKHGTSIKISNAQKQKVIMPPKGRPETKCKTGLKGAFVDFFEYTSIHGLRNLIDIDCYITQTVWILVLCCSFAGLTYQVTGLCTSFMNEPTVMVVKPTHPTSFPVVVYCPYNWADVRKMKKLNMRRENYHYLTSVLVNMFGYGFMPRLPLTTLQQAIMKQQLQEIIQSKANNSLDTLFKMISYDLDELLYMPNKEGIIPLKTSQVLNTAGGGACVRVEQMNVNYTLLTVSKAMMVLRFIQHMETFEGETPDFHFKANLLVVGSLADKIFPAGETYLSAHMDYSVKIRYSHLHFIDLQSRPCSGGDYADFINCVMECSLQVCRKLELCMPYVPYQNTSSLNGICSEYDYASSKNCFSESFTLPGLRDGCANKCPRPCEIESHTPLVAPLRPRKPTTNYITVQLSYLNPWHDVEAVERTVVDFSTVVSNVGGAIALWSGASFISFWEVIYSFACLRCEKRRNRKKRSKDKPETERY